jgi:hypothetical protein
MPLFFVSIYYRVGLLQGQSPINVGPSKVTGLYSMRSTEDAMHGR